ncbi:MAG: CDP-alcohol phosphatidyltransferase family protein [Ruminococcaceae bacterium]|nr:CDP-alcohol phosphatidyltransferase family protein [Oscillospiraceae bacterium]
MQRKDWLTIPNLLSLFRLVLIPIYVCYYLGAETKEEHFIAAVILMISSLTDLLDGWIARKFGMISKVGKALDPVADKCTQGIVMICLGMKYPVIWILFGLFVIKEGFMLAMGLFHLKHGKMPSGALMIGKICTTVLFISMILLVMIPDVPLIVLQLLIAICALFMLLSLGMYVVTFLGKNDYLQSIK